MICQELGFVWESQFSRRAPQARWTRARRLSNGFYLDTDAVYSDEGDTLKLTDHHGHGRQPQHADRRGRQVPRRLRGADRRRPVAMGIDAAAKKYPGKPFRYVVLTHHHIDHTGGVRAYAAQGATLVVGKGDGAFWRKVLSAPNGLDPYPVKLSGSPKLIDVNGKWSINDAGREIDAYSLENPHATGYLIPYVTGGAH